MNNVMNNATSFNFSVFLFAIIVWSALQHACDTNVLFIFSIVVVIGDVVLFSYQSLKMHRAEQALLALPSDGFCRDNAFIIVCVIMHAVTRISIWGAICFCVASSPFICYGSSRIVPIAFAVAFVATHFRKHLKRKWVSGKFEPVSQTYDV